MPNGYSVGNLELSIQTVGSGAITSLSLTNEQLKQMYRLIGGNNIQLGKMGSGFQKTFSFAKLFGKIYFIRNYTKQLAQSMVGLVQNAIDYTETLNLWQVAMRGNIATAEEFISKMNKAYGIAEETLMRYQATFRNMLSTLGGISADVSYGLSESLTQMALDYASLYNTSIERAMTVFQSVLSGQVRPIRSISGYDITETTIFELYQQLGGTKTMRQLTQTEKRLLRIYAVFQQMDRSGAIGDLNKTLNNTANQMRIMSESAKELGTWIGKLVEMYIAPMLPYINAFLITAKNVAKAIAQSMPDYEEFDGTIKGYEDTAEAIDQVQGKLLDFDKFRAMNSSDQNLGIGIDEKLLAGVAKYESLLENVSNKATKLADKWTKLFVGEDGTLTQKAQSVLNILKEIGTVLGIILGLGIIKKVGKIGGAILGVTKSVSLLNIALKAGLIYSIYQMIKAFQEGDKTMLAVYSLITGTIVVAYILLALHKQKVAKASMQLAIAQTQQAIATKNLVVHTNLLLEAMLRKQGANEIEIGMIRRTATETNKQVVATKSLAGSLGMVFTGISALAIGISTYVNGLSEMGTTAKWLIPILASLAGAFAFFAVMKQASSGDPYSALPRAIAMAAFVGGSALTLGTMISTKVKGFANGGMPEKGTMFVAGEAGAEMVYNTPSGQSGVANIQQIQQAMYGAMVAYGRTQNGGGSNQPIDIYIDGEKIFQATRKNAKRHGLQFSKV